MVITGKVFLRVFELREEIALFLERWRTAKELEFHLKMTDDTLIIKLAYLAVYFDEINKLNLSLQRKVASFLRNLQLYQRRDQAVSILSQLTTLLEGTEEKCPFAGDVMQHLHSTEESTSGHFPDLERRENNTWIMRNVFRARRSHQRCYGESRVPWPARRQHAECRLTRF